MQCAYAQPFLGFEAHPIFLYDGMDGQYEDYFSHLLLRLWPKKTLKAYSQMGSSGHLQALTPFWKISSIFSLKNDFGQTSIAQKYFESTLLLSNHFSPNRKPNHWHSSRRIRNPRLPPVPNKLRAPILDSLDIFQIQLRALRLGHGHRWREHRSELGGRVGQFRRVEVDALPCIVHVEPDVWHDGACGGFEAYAW